MLGTWNVTTMIKLTIIAQLSEKIPKWESVMCGIGDMNGNGGKSGEILA